MSSTEPLYILLLTSGFMVSLGHCIAMCGPIVVSLSLHLKGKAPILPHLLYNAGRVVTYTLLGGIMGITGSTTALLSQIDWLQKGVMIAGGAIIILMGLAMAGWIRLGRIFSVNYFPRDFFCRGLKALSPSKSFLGYGALGLLFGLLPCGPVYTAMIASARAGMEAQNAVEGFFTGSGLMTAFGLGTVPALLVIGRLIDLRWLKPREVIYKLGAVAMLIVGLFFMIKGIRH
jgi:sulfite exporter TauE/SafE